MRRKLLLGAVIAVWGLAIPGALPEQVTTTTLFGGVTDSTGAAIARAQVTATNTDTNAIRTEQTNAEGEYRMELPPVGNYSLEVSTTGFKRFVRSGIVLELNVPARVDVTMKLGEFAQTVGVTGVTLNAFYAYSHMFDSVPAQPVDATPCSALIRQCFHGRTIRLAVLDQNLARAAFPLL
jgi:hypothetical protein